MKIGEDVAGLSVPPFSSYPGFTSSSGSFGNTRLRGRTGRELKGEFHGSAHARILTGLCTLSGTGPGFSLFMNQS